MRVTASVLNVRSGPGTDFRVMRTVLKGDSVTVLETHGDWAWIGVPGEGWVSLAYLAHELVNRPRGLHGITSFFGPPGKPDCYAGRILLPKPLKLGWSDAEVGRLACHIKLEQTFTQVFQQIYAEGLWDAIKTYDGIYNDRKTKTGSKTSTHAWGISIDLNAATNRMGTRGDMNPGLVRIFEAYGFKWLGPDYDPMHFQYAEGY